MASDRIRLLSAVLGVSLAAYVGANATMAGLASWVELTRDGYLWWSEEWLQLLVGHNFKDRGSGRILLAGSSEAREDFLSDEMEAVLPDWDVYNNAYSNQTLGTLLLVLQYMEAEYGPGSLPDKLVIGCTPWFLLDDPSNDVSFFPRTINRYSPRFSMDVGTVPPSLARKSPLESLGARYRFLTHQSRRYRGALRGVWRAANVALVPESADEYSLKLGLVPSMYHHLPPIDQQEQLEQLRASPRSSADPRERLEALHTEFAALRELAERQDIDLYFVNMPQSTWMLDRYFGDTYALYLDELGRLLGEIPYLDLSRSLADNEFYDILHADLEASRKTSRRVAEFVRDGRGG